MRPPPNAPRRGVMWVDVLIVLAVIALIVGLAVPAIMQAREAARRTQCNNNLKQLGFALHNYHDNFRTFPPGYVVSSDGVYLGWNWALFLVPYIEASPLYNQFPLNGGLQSNPRLECYATPYRPYICPTDGGSKTLPHTFVVTTPVTDGLVTPATLDVPNHYARSNYFGVAGYLHADAGGIAIDASGEPAGTGPLVNAGSLGNLGTTFSVGHRYCDPANFRGVFGQNSLTKIADIKDGTSNVLIVGERYTPKNGGPHAVGHGTWVGVPDCTTAAGLAMALGDTAVKPNAGTSTRAETTGFGSAHTGGFHVLCADGSAHFVRDSIDIALYRGLSVIADGKPSRFCDEF